MATGLSTTVQIVVTPEIKAVSQTVVVTVAPK